MGRLLPLALLLLIPIIAGCGGGGSSSVSQQVPASGGTVTFGDAVTVQFPQGAVPDGTKVTIAKGGAPNDKLVGGRSLGSAFNIDLGGAKLSKPVTLVIAFDPKKLPKDASAGTAFLAHYDEAKKDWIPVAGTVDSQRNVITIQTDHLSWWNPFTWDWGAWIAVLNNALTGNVTDFLHAVALLTTGCPQSGATVSVDASKANNVIQGCVQQDDPSSPQLRVVNPKSFFFEVKPASGGNGYPPDTMLGPGDDLKFQASTSDPTPLVVQAEITQKAGLYLVVHLVIQMLPGLNELGIQGSQIACITEKLADVSYFISASEALLVSHDGAAAAEQLIHFLNDADAVRRFITAASDCSYGAAPTWSVEGIKQIGAATATIISAADFVANYLLNNHSEVAFNWTRAARPVQALGTFLCHHEDQLVDPYHICLFPDGTSIVLDFDRNGGAVTGTGHGEMVDALDKGCTFFLYDLQFHGTFDVRTKTLSGNAVLQVTVTPPGCASGSISPVSGNWTAELLDDGVTIQGTAPGVTQGGTVDQNGVTHPADTSFRVVIQ